MDNITLEKYADLLVNLGLRLEKGENLLINIDENGLELARKISEQAYKLGARDVKINLMDTAQANTRYLYGNEEALKSLNNFDIEHKLSLMKARYHTIRLCTYNEPDARLDLDRVTSYDMMMSKALKEVRGYAMRSDIKWTVAPVVSDDWGQLIYPELEVGEARELVESELSKILRLDAPSPIQSWSEHNKRLARVRDKLNELELVSLHFKDEFTDLEVGLADKAWWCGGEDKSSYGATFMANIPTEEVFTMPHKYRVEGRVKVRKPFQIFGKKVGELELEFEGGKVVDFSTDVDTTVIDRLLEMDEGASRLGEIALVERTSPINNFNHVFFNTLIDENACSHMAFGDSYDDTSKSSLGEEESGANTSSIHVDVMIGSSEMLVTGKNDAGEMLLIMKDGLFVI